ncbi:unnamed protein product [Lupinus luteus]|uniref:RNase H type-1 domain-containing protein n=1 Tax=Lupinus luteus TaxID=3873 RepID=A0AAV1XEQ0_LUPLU
MKNRKDGDVVAIKATRYVSYTPPLSGFIELNVDAIYMGDDNHIGYGGVLRDTISTCIVGFSKFVGKGSVLLAELLGIRDGLILAWENKFRNIVRHSDSLMAVELSKRVPIGPEFNPATAIGPLNRPEAKRNSCPPLFPRQLEAKKLEN